MRSIALRDDAVANGDYRPAALEGTHVRVGRDPGGASLVSLDSGLFSDGNKAREIADYMNQNPSARVAIDGANGRRVNRVRDALINAGVPAYKIQTGSFGDPQQRRDGRVAVLVSSL